MESTTIGPVVVSDPVSISTRVAIGGASKIGRLSTPCSFDASNSNDWCAGT